MIIFIMISFSNDIAAKSYPGQSKHLKGQLDPPVGNVTFFLHQTGWQKLHGSTGGTRQKFWTQTKISSPNIRYFVAIYALFGDLWAKKVPFWVKNSGSWARSSLTHGKYCIFH